MQSVSKVAESIGNARKRAMFGYGIEKSTAASRLVLGGILAY